MPRRTRPRLAIVDLAQTPHDEVDGVADGLDAGCLFV
jgi:hypothetical protein